MSIDELDRLVEKLDLERKVRLLTGATVWSTYAEPGIGLRAMVTSDGPVGVRGEGWDERSTSLTLPSATALAATWDDDLVELLGGLLAAEARRKGVDVLLAPTLNLHRSPLGGRHFECYSEDPLLTGRIGVACVRGIQAGGVAATAKHYVANDSETERLTLDARVDERTLRELYLAPFEAVVEAGVWVVMSAYNGVNGATMSESPLLADPLKEAWGFDGVVVSDWGGVRSTAPAARAAQDLAMPGPEGAWGEALVAAVRAGEVPEAAIDDKVRRLLRLASRVGALDLAGSAEREGDAGPQEHGSARALLRRAVAASTVLLRNEDSLLPLDPSRLRRVAVLGPNAAAARIQGGGSAGVYPMSVVSPLDGIREALSGTAEVFHSPGPHLDDRPTPLGTDNARNPLTGEPGVLVRLLDATGAEIHAEHRLTGRILEPARIDVAAVVEIRALLSPEVDGLWELAVAGWGHVLLEADGRVLVDEEVERDTDDPATVHLSPPYRRARFPVTAGRDVELVSRRRLDPDSGIASVLAADPPRRADEAELAAAVELARTCDAVIVVVGSTEEIENEGADRTHLDLPGRQDELVRAVAAANPATVVVVNSGGPMVLPWREEVPAVLLSWFPGQEAGHGLADVLFGRAEPGGRLPTTWADRALVSTVPEDGTLAYSEGLDIGYRAWLRRPAPPAYWFGHGLGYTSWSYEDISVPWEVSPESSPSVRVRLRNTGERAGREVVQVYLSRPETGVARPARWLAGYALADAGPGEVVEVTVDVPARAFQHWSAEDHAWRAEEGAFTVLAGRSAADLPLSAAVLLGTEPPTPREASGERSLAVL
ncbi:MULTISPECIES: glycoside hydrolase family 3 C-terminal domain-containing protein [unclassified Streptosporangium]|uniref:glycoside hydrolase family 3 C-terminal domain-containing protein n=1 Tax=unclassified Streptosporangium TaxID=2632669 RepID=UPI002E283AD7|nr:MULTISPECIES: glycoside hydrolase family 3 C-terminal domain-containing protein [unclassified Streptosporangium]